MAVHVVRCKCGKNTMGFFKSPGDYYIDECCKLAGFDHLGNFWPPGKKKPEPPKPRKKYERTGKFEGEAAKQKVRAETTKKSEDSDESNI